MYGNQNISLDIARIHEIYMDIRIHGIYMDIWIHEIYMDIRT